MRNSSTITVAKKLMAKSVAGCKQFEIVSTFAILLLAAATVIDCSRNPSSLLFRLPDHAGRLNVLSQNTSSSSFSEFPSTLGSNGQLPVDQADGGSSSTSSLGLIVGTVVGCLLILVLVTICSCYRKKVDRKVEEESVVVNKNIPPSSQPQHSSCNVPLSSTKTAPLPSANRNQGPSQKIQQEPQNQQQLQLAFPTSLNKSQGYSQQGQQERQQQQPRSLNKNETPSQEKQQTPLLSLNKSKGPSQTQQEQQRLSLLNNKEAPLQRHQQQPLATLSKNKGLSQTQQHRPYSKSKKLSSFHSLCIFEYKDLVTATGNFGADNYLGRGGFGPVFSGVLEDGIKVAVKQLIQWNSFAEQQFQSEIETIGRIHHRHLVMLLGYCIHGEEGWFLVYEFVPNCSLQHHLHGKNRPTLKWKIRFDVALGSARGLAYLHEDCEPKIIHRDIKAANILLDGKFEAKVGDFGLAKFLLGEDTHVSTKIAGTRGYLAPEYANYGKLRDSCDVFSFGVVLLELITGGVPLSPLVTGPSILSPCLYYWARPLLRKALQNGNYDTFVDPKLEGKYDPVEMHRMVACAAACTLQEPKLRPSMTRIVQTLRGEVPVDDLVKKAVKINSKEYPDHQSSKEVIKQFRDL